MPPPILLARLIRPEPRSPLPAAIADPSLADTSSPILPRQAATTTITTIPAYYGALDSSPDPGAVAGITLGAVGGFLLVLFLIYYCINIGNPPETAESTVTGSVVMERKSRHTSHRHSHGHHHHRRSGGGEATVEIRRSTRVPAAVIVEERVVGGPGGERVIVEEARRRSVSRGPRIVDLASDEDEVVVIEEHSPPPRRRRSRVRSVERRSGVYVRRDSSSRG